MHLNAKKTNMQKLNEVISSYQMPKSRLLENVKNVKDHIIKRLMTDSVSQRYLNTGTIKATEIPFVKYIGIKEKENRLSLSMKNNIYNHVATIHAAAQFTLAETESGMHLQTLFPDLKQKVIPLLRDGQIKYKKPAAQTITAHSFVDKTEVEKFKMQFEKKGRALLKIKVEIRDVNDVLTSEAQFLWFVQARPEETDA